MISTAVIEGGKTIYILSLVNTYELTLKLSKAVVIALTVLLVTLYEADSILIGVIPVILLPLHEAINLLPSF
jgi:hypothetical protein